MRDHIVLPVLLQPWSTLKTSCTCCLMHCSTAMLQLPFTPLLKSKTLGCKRQNGAFKMAQHIKVLIAKPDRVNPWAP